MDKIELDHDSIEMIHIDGKQYALAFVREAIAGHVTPADTLSESLDSQVNRLAQFIMDEVPGEPSESQGAVDTAIRIIRAYLAATTSELVAVKALEWDARERPDLNGSRYWRAQTSFDWGYRIYLDDGRYVWQGNNADFASLDEAKNAIQADYERRIRSALTTPPAAPTAIDVAIEASDSFNAIVDAVEARCLATDGPVTPTLAEMREDELSALWRAVQDIRASLKATRETA